jgi:hypothetical protein
MTTQSVETPTARNVAIARAAYEAYVTKDRAALEKLIAEGFLHESPRQPAQPRNVLPPLLAEQPND